MGPLQITDILLQRGTALRFSAIESKYPETGKESPTPFAPALGFPGLRWASLGFPGLQRQGEPYTVRACSGLPWAFLGFPGFQRQGKPYTVRACSGPPWASLGLPEPPALPWASLGFPGLPWAFLGFPALAQWLWQGVVGGPAWGFLAQRLQTRFAAGGLG